MKKIGLTLRVEHARERRDCLDQEWYKVLARNGLWPVPLPNVPDPPMGVGGLLEELDLAGVVLTGGNDLSSTPGARDPAPERDRFEAQVLDACAERGLPVLGVCRGFHMMISHYGGRLVPAEGHVATRHPLVVAPDCVLPLEDRDEVNSFHDFTVTVDGLGRELRVMASSSDGMVEAAAHAHLPQWGIMWHPEREPFDPRDADILRVLFDASTEPGQ